MCLCVWILEGRLGGGLYLDVGGLGCFSFMLYEGLSHECIDHRGFVEIMS